MSDLLAHTMRFFDPIFHIDGVTEIMANEDGGVYYEAFGQEHAFKERIPDTTVSNIIRTLAGLVGKIVDASHPELSCKLPYKWGGRVHALIPPVVTKPILCIRVPTRRMMTIEELIGYGAISHAQSMFLEESITLKRKLFFAGSTGSGKTTVANAFLQNIDGRAIIIEDTPEIKVKSPNSNYILTNQDFQMVHAVRAALRLNPAYLVVGEVRDGATALNLLKLFQSLPCGGVTTIHADTAEGVPLRLRELILEERDHAPVELIDREVEVICFCEKRKHLDKTIRVVSKIIHKGKEVKL